MPREITIIFIRCILSASLGAVAMFAGTATGANAEPAASPAPSASAAVPASDPCGDTNLLATTDRPTFGTNPCVVKPNATIIELGYRNTATSVSGASSRVASYPQNRDRIGIAPKLEFVLDLPTDLRAAGAGGTQSGDSGIGTGLKYELGYFGSFVHGFAAEAVYPTGSPAFSSGLPSFNYSYQIGGGIVHNVGFNFTLGFNSFSAPRPAGGGNTATNAFAPTLIIGGVVAPQTKLNVEVANTSSSGPGSSGQYFGNVFLQHQVSKDLLLDVEAEQRFTVVRGAHQHYIGAGGSIRI